MDESQKKWDLKQITVGGGSVLALLFLFQSQGIELMSANQRTNNELVIEKTLANSARITKVEDSVKDLNDKLDRGFESLRKQVSHDFDRISEMIIDRSHHLFTKNDQMIYAESIEKKFDKVDRQLDSLRREISKKEK